MKKVHDDIKKKLVMRPKVIALVDTFNTFPMAFMLQITQLDTLIKVYALLLQTGGLGGSSGEKSLP